MQQYISWRSCTFVIKTTYTIEVYAPTRRDGTSAVECARQDAVGGELRSTWQQQTHQQQQLEDNNRQSLGRVAFQDETTRDWREI